MLYRKSVNCPDCGEKVHFVRFGHDACCPQCGCIQRARIVNGDTTPLSDALVEMCIVLECGLSMRIGIDRYVRSVSAAEVYHIQNLYKRYGDRLIAHTEEVGDECVTEYYLV